MLCCTPGRCYNDVHDENFASSFEGDVILHMPVACMSDSKDLEFDAVEPIRAQSRSSLDSPSLDSHLDQAHLAAFEALHFSQKEKEPFEEDPFEEDPFEDCAFEEGNFDEDSHLVGLQASMSSPCRENFPEYEYTDVSLCSAPGERDPLIMLNSGRNPVLQPKLLPKASPKVLFVEAARLTAMRENRAERHRQQKLFEKRCATMRDEFMSFCSRVQSVNVQVVEPDEIAMQDGEKVISI